MSFDGTRALHIGAVVFIHRFGSRLNKHVHFQVCVAAFWCEDYLAGRKRHESPFPAGSFDVVLCQHGLQFVPDRPAVVQEMNRVLAPGGRALVIVLQALNRHPIFETLIKSVTHHLSLPVSAVMTPFALSDADELRSLFTAAGFKNIEIVAESTMVRFPEPKNFVPFSVTSSAAAVPAFAQLDEPERAALLKAVRMEVEPLIPGLDGTDALTFPMFAHIALASS